MLHLLSRFVLEVPYSCVSLAGVIERSRVGSHQARVERAMGECGSPVFDIVQQIVGDF